MSQTKSHDLRGPILILAGAILAGNDAMVRSAEGLGITLGALIGFVGLCFTAWVRPKDDE